MYFSIVYLNYVYLIRWMKEMIDKADREAREKRTRTGAAAARCGNDKLHLVF